jgi:hypothetical protein
MEKGWMASNIKGDAIDAAYGQLRRRTVAMQKGT